MSTTPRLSTQEENVLAAVNAGALHPSDKENVKKRRANTKVRGLNHHAYYARDVEQTRHFYEERPRDADDRIPNDS